MRGLLRAAYRPDAEPVDDVEHAGGEQVADQVGSTRIEAGVCSAGLSTTALPAAAPGELPDRHQHREVPGDDLPTTPRGSLSGRRRCCGRSRRGRPPGRGSRRRSSGSRRWQAARRRRWFRGSACRCPRSRRGQQVDFASIRSAIRFRINARSATLARPRRPWPREPRRARPRRRSRRSGRSPPATRRLPAGSCRIPTGGRLDPLAADEVAIPRRKGRRGRAKEFDLVHWFPRQGDAAGCGVVK